MRLTKKEKIKELTSLKKHNVLMTDNDYKELKLGQLEDIEDKLGIEFSILDKICQNGVYCYKKAIKSFNSVNKKLDEIIHIQNSDIHIQLFGVYNKKRIGVSMMGSIDCCFHSLPIKDYGKTWALAKEELEDE